MHSAWVDPCEYSKCEYLGHTIFGSWDCVRAVPIYSKLQPSRWSYRDSRIDYKSDPILGLVAGPLSLWDILPSSRIRWGQIYILPEVKYLHSCDR